MRTPWLVLLALTGCTAPYLRVDPALATAAPRPALLVANVVTTASDGDKGLLQGTLDLAANAQVDGLGRDVSVAAQALLEARHLSWTEDPARAKTVAKGDYGDLVNNLQTLSGVWIDPRGELFTLQSMTPRKLYAKVADRLNGPVDPEAFVFLRTTIEDRTKFLVMKYPRCNLDVEVVSDQGTLLYDLRTYGDGKAKFLVRDRLPANLHIALEDALDRAAALPVDPPKD